MNTQTDETKLVEMLTENTGRSILDSGDCYGRHWELNQNANFDRQAEGCVEFWQQNGKLDIVSILNVYHFLKDRVTYNPELDQQYREYVESEDGYLDLQSAEAFAESLDGKGIYGDDSGPFTINTYNGEDLLSQIIQFVYWTDDNRNAHVLLQIHGGCDARGGYTAPVAFDLTDYDGTSIFDNTRGTIYCSDCENHWDSDDGCSWRAEDGKDLTEYPATDNKPDYPNTGVVWVDDDHAAHCPQCGRILKLAPWPCY